MGKGYGDYLRTAKGEVRHTQANLHKFMRDTYGAFDATEIPTAVEVKNAMFWATGVSFGIAQVERRCLLWKQILADKLPPLAPNVIDPTAKYYFVPLYIQTHGRSGWESLVSVDRQTMRFATREEAKACLNERKPGKHHKIWRVKVKP